MNIKMLQQFQRKEEKSKKLQRQNFSSWKFFNVDESLSEINCAVYLNFVCVVEII